jgi:hypothetical protein
MNYTFSNQADTTDNAFSMKSGDRNKLKQVNLVNDEESIPFK